MKTNGYEALIAEPEVDPAASQDTFESPSRPVPLAPRSTSATHFPAALSSRPRERRHQLRPLDFRHPLLLVDPRGSALHAVEALRQRHTPLHVLTSRRLEPSYFARAVGRHRLPSLQKQPDDWSTKLLELTAHLEPRPLLWPFSMTSYHYLRQQRRTLAPHFDCVAFEDSGVSEHPSFGLAEPTLRRAVLHAEPVIEVQMTMDRQAHVTGEHVLSWSIGAAPYVIASSIAGEEFLEKSRDWLFRTGMYGFARLIFAPDRFGKVGMQAVDPFPGNGWYLATRDGVDLPSAWYAAVLGMQYDRQVRKAQPVQRLSLCEPGHSDAELPLVAPAASWSWRDPLPAFVNFLSSMVRR